MSDASGVLRDATRRLARAGVPDPMRDARRLLDHAAGRNHMLIDAVTSEVQARFQDLVNRRARREPVSHIVGRRAFWTLELEVTPDVLDPRPETEILVQAGLASGFQRVLDLGTGSGAILLSLLSEMPAATGVGTDISSAALTVAQRNLALLGAAERAHFIQSDWFDRVAGRFDLIVSNPPYIARDEMPGLSPEVLHEPRMALTDEADGLGAYRRITSGLRAHLAPGGRVLLEIGPTQAEAVTAMLADIGLTEIRVIKDLDGRNRVIGAKMPV